MTEIVAFAGAVSHAMNVAKAIVDTRDETKLASLKLEFTTALLELHDKQLSLSQFYQSILEANESLKKQLAAYERWEQESQRYERHQPELGFLVYALKPEHAATQPAHWLCAACYDDGKQSVLQRAFKGATAFNCPRDERHKLDMSEYD